MTLKGWRDTIQELTNRRQGVPMTDIDLRAQFDQISDKAKNASDKLEAASQSTRDRLETDAISARDRADAAADRLNDRAVHAKDEASSQWQEMRANWHAHVAKVKADVRNRQDRLDAHLAVKDADHAEDYALSAIDFAQATLEEAEAAVLDAMYSRANAIALDSTAR
jgi:uncharacterized protein YicC (UPF0701 family)